MKQEKNGTNGNIFFTDGKLLGKDLKPDFEKALEYLLVKDRTTVNSRDIYFALAFAIRHRLIRKWLRTQYEYRKQDAKRVYYLSMEFLMGRLMGNMLTNTEYYKECSEILMQLGYNLEDIRDVEPDMGLGNGGLGRLAACFLDSMATMSLPAYGYGIRYEYGIFKQEIKNGWQIELPDNWLKYGCPWEIARPHLEYRVQFGGRVATEQDGAGRFHFKWVDTEDVIALAFDVPVPGYRNNTVNNLRLWQAKATTEFDFSSFNSGDYMAAVDGKNKSENISKVLYPNDNVHAGKILRLKQQYFFVSATLQDIIYHFKKAYDDFREFPDKVAIQLNDTHPVIAIPELMRLLMDQEGFEWTEAWDITKRTFGYTNHTILPEALEKWDVELLGPLLPRQLQIIYEINRRFHNELRDMGRFDDNAIAKMSIVEEATPKMVRMAHLAIVGSHSVNGVSQLHTDILMNDIFRDFCRYNPTLFNNKTNGITPRRWLKKANPFLANIISDRIGEEWVTDLDKLRKLEPFVDDAEFRELWREAKLLAKRHLARYIKETYGVAVNHNSIFDVQIKRLHEYKRQLLNVLHVITLYNRIKANPSGDFVPRTVIFGGKAAPGYQVSKLIIKLINSVAQVVNNDPAVGDRLKVLFLKNYSVSLAEKIIPATDLSEQISTAGYEASGTGNMKFMLNGALTIGTLDGANVEMAEEVGMENIFIFGLKAHEVRELKKRGYSPQEYYQRDNEMRKVLDMINTDYFNKNEPGIFQFLYQNIVLFSDHYCLLADYRAYVDTQEKVSALFRDQEAWTKKSILNTARSGKFSSDRTIMQYADEIWKVKPVIIPDE
ncbi:MAG TPA: glycogen/starch/alpha-glucan phosphorylase [bacterium]|nr:glycogen/starch/alpha-glucan phosphorylase [bacterium]